MIGVGGLVAQPAGEVVGEHRPGGQDDVPRPGRPDRVHQRLHARGPVRQPGAGPAAAQPAAPALALAARGGLRERLVEQVEDDRVVAPERPGHRAPERDRLRGVRHRLLAQRLRRRAERGGAGVGAVGPVQVEDRHHVVAGQQPHVRLDRPPVGCAPVPGRDVRLAVPAGLVQRHAHRVDVPALHRADRRLVHRAVPEAGAVHAAVLPARAVHAVQHHPLAGRADQPVP